MEITGIITNILPSLSGVSARTGNNWMSQEYVIQTEEQYPHSLCFKVFGEDRIKNFNIKIGERLTILFDTQANEFKGKFYNEVNCFNIKRETQQQEAPAQQAQYPSQQVTAQSAAVVPHPVAEKPADLFTQQQEAPIPAQGESDDLPF